MHFMVAIWLRVLVDSNLPFLSPTGLWGERSYIMLGFMSIRASIPTIYCVGEKSGSGMNLTALENRPLRLTVLPSAHGRIGGTRTHTAC